MKRLFKNALLICLAAVFFSACDQKAVGEEERYLQVIGEYEQAMPDGGFRLNLSYNGPMSLRKKFDTWADSMQKVLPGMVKTNDNIYINYMPEQMGKKITDDMFQVGVGYNLTVADSTTYSQITKDLLRQNIPFSLNMTGAFVEPGKKVGIQKEMLQKAIENAKVKLDFLKGDSSSTYEIISIEELDNQQPYGPDYYDYNRRMATRVKVRAQLN